LRFMMGHGLNGAAVRIARSASDQFGSSDSESDLRTILCGRFLGC